MVRIFGTKATDWLWNKHKNILRAWTPISSRTAFLIPEHWFSEIEKYLITEYKLIVDKSPKNTYHARVTLSEDYNNAKIHSEWFYTRESAILDVLYRIPYIGKILMYVDYGVPCKKFIDNWNDMINTVCYKHGIFPQLIHLMDNRYTFHEIVWDCFTEQLEAEDKTHYELLEMLTKVQLTDYKALNEIIGNVNKEMEKEEMTQTETKLMTMAELNKLFNEELTKHSVYESKKQADYEMLLYELVGDMCKVANVPTPHNTIQEILLERQFLEDIIIPEAICAITKIKPSSQKYKEAKFLFENRYCKVLIEDNKEINVQEFIQAMKTERKVYVINSRRYKYVPSYLSNQTIYQDQYVDDYGVHYTEPEMIEILERAKYPKNDESLTSQMINTLKMLGKTLDEHAKIQQDTLKLIERNYTLHQAINEKVNKLNTPYVTSGYMRVEDSNWMNNPICNTNDINTLNKEGVKPLTYSTLECTGIPIVEPQQEMRVSPVFSEGGYEVNDDIQEQVDDLFTIPDRNLTETTKEQDKVDISVPKDDLDIVEEYLKDKENLRDRQFNKRVDREFDKCYTVIPEDILNKINEKYKREFTGIKIKSCNIYAGDENTRTEQAFKVWIPDISTLLKDLASYFNEFELKIVTKEDRYMQHKLFVKKGKDCATFMCRSLVACVLILLANYEFSEEQLKSVI